MHEPLKIQNSHFLGILPQGYRGAKISDITENLLYNSWFPESNIIFFNNVFIRKHWAAGQHVPSSSNRDGHRLELQK